jgi:hypothetical protein
MSPQKVDEVLGKLNSILEDFQMLRDGSWVPDEQSVEASIDNVNDVISIIENV